MGKRTQKQTHESTQTPIEPAEYGPLGDKLREIALKRLQSGGLPAGYEEGGLLTEFVRNNPNCVILFDEVEKCEPKVLDILLHILDEGFATDNLNREIDFTKSIIVMTSNLGHKEKSKKSMGFIPAKEDEKSVK